MKAFIISDDFTELNYLQALLSKMGVKTETAKNPRVIAEALISFNPDIAMISDRSKSFKGVDTAIEIKKKYSRIQVVLIKNSNTNVDDKLTFLDGFLDSPVGVAKLVDLVAKLLNKNVDELSSKLKLNIEKSKNMANDSGSIHVTGSVGGDDKIHVTGDVSSSKETSHVTRRLDSGCVGSGGHYRCRK
ncbi:MAG: hypothetical protein R2827_09110 [Bdellovibrionales bacterium]